MKLLVDMNPPPRWVQVLAEAGFEASHWTQVGAPSAPDVEIMAYAAAHGLVVLTTDLDFGDILAASGNATPSVVLLRADDLRPEALAASLVAALRQAGEALGQGALLSVDPARAHMRLLPLGGRD